MHKKLTLSLISIYFIFNTGIIQAAESANFVYGLKYGEDKSVLWTKALLPDETSFKGGYNHLLPFVTPAPYQDNAGSCLFMSHTGVVEILMGQKYNRKFDFSERYYMNLMKSRVGSELMNNWRVDTAYRLNVKNEIYSNKDYKFGKGYYKKVNGKRVYTNEDDPDAKYGTQWNWIVDLNRLFTDQSKRPIHLPPLEREILFEDPEENQWNFGIAPKDIVKRVKQAFAKRKAPIEVIYNHHGFWHANVIVGYNDHADSKGCPFVSNYKSRMDARAEEIRKEAEQLEDGPEKDKLLRKAKKFNRNGLKVHQAFLKNGGCRNRGVFYVRDSIYPSENQTLYDYDRNKEGEEAHLNEPVILRSYEWLERLSNNVVQIYFK